LETPTTLGTAFAVTNRTAVTAYHCVGDRRTGVLYGNSIAIDFPGGRVQARVIACDLRHDLALLELHDSIPSQLRPIPLSRLARRHASFAAGGWPINRPFPCDQYEVSGRIVTPRATIFGGIDSIQLFCEQAAAGQPMHGLSGAPIIVQMVNGEEAAIGLIRCSPDSSGTGIADGGTLYGSPVSAVIDICGLRGCEIVREPFEYGICGSTSMLDVDWAKWIDKELDNAGLHAYLRVRDLRPGDNYVEVIEEYFRDIKVFYVIVSADYSTGMDDIGAHEKRIMLASGKDARRIPVRIDDSKLPEFLQHIVPVELQNRDEEQAKELLMQSVRPHAAVPSSCIKFPGRAAGASLRTDDNCQTPIVTSTPVSGRNDDV
jgi:hypothetical protein